MRRDGDEELGDAIVPTSPYDSIVEAVQRAVAAAEAAGAREERKRIVDWLVNQAKEYAGHNPWADALDMAADEIEAGTHTEEE